MSKPIDSRNLPAFFVYFCGLLAILARTAGAVANVTTATTVATTTQATTGTTTAPPLMSTSTSTAMATSTTSQPPAPGSSAIPSYGIGMAVGIGFLALLLAGAIYKLWHHHETMAKAGLFSPPPPPSEVDALLGGSALDIQVTGNARRPNPPASATDAQVAAAALAGSDDGTPRNL